MIKKKISIALLIFSYLLIFISCSKNTASQASKQNYLVTDDSPTFWIISDPHFLSPALYDKGEAFEKILATTAGKDLIYQEQSWLAFVQQAKKEKPAGIVITGDLTFNGEKQSAEMLSKWFETLENEGINVFVLPGNHDIHNGWARAYVGNEQIRTEQISSEAFTNLFTNSYKKAISTDKTSLSYAVNISPDYRFILLDSNQYTLTEGTRGPTTAGKIKPKTLAWLKNQLITCAEDNQEPIIFLHHNLYKHNQLIHKGYVLNNADDVLDILKDYHVSLIFSGHIHAQDALKDGKNNIVEIVTGSFAISPQIIGKLTLKNSNMFYSAQPLSLTDWVSSQPLVDEPLTHYSDYLKQLFIKDGKRLAYSSLIEKGIYEDDILEPVADLVGELNWRFFSGQDTISNDEITKIKESKGYQLLIEYAPDLKNYVDSIMQDHNLNDLQITIQKNK